MKIIKKIYKYGELTLMTQYKEKARKEAAKTMKKVKEAMKLDYFEE